MACSRCGGSQRASERACALPSRVHGRPKHAHAPRARCGQLQSSVSPQTRPPLCWSGGRKHLFHLHHPPCCRVRGRGAWRAGLGGAPALPAIFSGVACMKFPAGLIVDFSIPKSTRQDPNEAVGAATGAQPQHCVVPRGEGIDPRARALNAAG